MQIVELKIDDNYVDSVLNLLKSLKDDMIKEINIKKPYPNNDEENILKEFHSLVRKGNNQVILTKKSALDTDDMIDDIL